MSGAGGSDVRKKFWVPDCSGRFLLNQLLGLEEAAQVEDLPRGQTNQTAHGEDAEVQHTRVGGL